MVSSRYKNDFEFCIESGHLWLKRLSFLEKTVFHFPVPAGIHQDLYHLRFPSPVTIAAFEGDIDIVKIWMQFGFGAATFKTILKEPRTGNARPRIQKVDMPEGEGLLNAMGLPGKGLKGFLDYLQTGPCFSAEKPLGFSIGGHSIEEYQQNCFDVLQFLKQDPIYSKLQTYLEINISCPNTPDGQDMLKYPGLLDGLIQFIRHHDPMRVVGIKLSPDQSNTSLQQFAEIIRPYPYMFLNLGNTSYRKCTAIGLPENAISIGGGGLSGPTLFKRTLEMSALLAPFGIPIMATGGIQNSEHILQLRKNGAILFGMATSLVQDPYRVPKINYELGVKKR